MKRAKIDEKEVTFGDGNLKSIANKLARTVHADMSRVIKHYLPEDVISSLQRKLDEDRAIEFALDNRVDCSDFKVKCVSTFTQKTLAKFVRKHITRALSITTARYPVPLLSLAVKQGRIDVARFLLEAGATHTAAFGGSNCFCHPLEFAQDIETIDLFLEYRYNINFRCIHGCNSFRMIYNSVPGQRKKNLILSYIVRRGADPVSPNTQISDLAPFLKQLVLERVFVKVIAAAIRQPGTFRDFLAEGVCDARILIHVAAFT